MNKLFTFLITAILCATTINGCSTVSSNNGSNAASQSTSGWTSQKDPDSKRNELISIWGTSPSDVFTVGVQGTILHYNGKDGVR